MLSIAVLVSGGGTNLQAIIDAIDNKVIDDAKIDLVISSNESAYALERAKKHNIKTETIVPKKFSDVSEYDKALLDLLTKEDPDLIVLAGFMTKVPIDIIQRFRGRIINIHPSLIPSFCGKGHYGLHVHEAALKRGVKITGATVHYVDEGLDTGPIILQKAVEVKENDSPGTLQKRVMEEAEHIILPKAINMIAKAKKSQEEV